MCVCVSVRSGDDVASFLFTLFLLCCLVFSKNRGLRLAPFSLALDLSCRHRGLLDTASSKGTEAKRERAQKPFFPPSLLVLRSIKTIKTFFLQRRWRLTRQLPLPLPLPLPATQPPLPPSSRTPRPPSTTGSCASGGSRRRSGKGDLICLVFSFSVLSFLRPLL